MSEGLEVLPLGGCGEVGLNATLFVHGRSALLVDCGVAIAPDPGAGVDRAVPDFSVIHERGLRLEALVLTHGHEDHIGAVGWLLKELDPPIYATRLTARFVEQRLESAWMSGKLHPIEYGVRLSVGPFSFELIRVTHSIPESAAVSLTAGGVTVLHSGDFKLDPTPIDGRPTDTARLAELGAGGVDLLLADSTNAERPGAGRSEAAIGPALSTLVSEARGRVYVACFASHLHRLQAIADAALASGRHLGLGGRSLKQAFRIGVSERILRVNPSLLVDERHLAKLERHRALVAVTGSQGEPRAALARLAAGLDPELGVGPGDLVLLSATVIPGNEVGLRRIVNQLTSRGARVVTDRMAPIHCSGHAHEGEQAELLRLVRPRAFVPIHGDRGMLEAHAALARRLGVPDVLVLEDGQAAVVAGGRLTRAEPFPARARPIDEATGRLIDPELVQLRRRLGRAGVLVVAVPVDGAGRLGRPGVRGLGVPGDFEPLGRHLAEALAELDEPGRLTWPDRAADLARRWCTRHLAGRPEVLVVPVPG